MSVQIFIDPIPHGHYTNLDFITGKVCLHLTSDATLSAIVVKLEGESRSRLVGPVMRRSDREKMREKVEMEVHKLLYKTNQVFPGQQLESQGPNNAQWTLPAGNYEYPFSFKIPFNNDCIANAHPLAKLNKMGFGIDLKDTYHHIKNTLPPTFRGFPGLAEIRYYIKVTVEYPQFYKGNLRAFTEFRFLPIEPPRPQESQQESFARRTLQFSKRFADSKNPFDKMSQGSANSESPNIAVEIRLPQPPIITCNAALPLRIIAKKVNAASEQVFVQMLQIELISYSHIRARELSRTESDSWLVMSKSNMNYALGKAGDPVATEWLLDQSFWAANHLPNTVPPSFDACNISRKYELDVRVGLSHGGNPEILVFPLRMPVQVFSGIAPPAAVLEALTSSSASTKPTTIAPPYEPVDSHPAPGSVTPGIATPSWNSVPAQSGDYLSHPPSASNEAPPSYEDAMADNVAPVGGPRGDYQPQREASSGGNDARRDEKASASLWQQGGQSSSLTSVAAAQGSSSQTGFFSADTHELGISQVDRYELGPGTPISSNPASVPRRKPVP